MGVCWTHYPEIGLYDIDMLRAATLAHAGVEDVDFILRHEREAVTTLSGVLLVASIDSITEEFRHRGKVLRVFRQGVPFPEIYHLKLLGRTER